MNLFSGIFIYPSQPFFLTGCGWGVGEGVKGGADFQCFKNNVLKIYTGDDLEFSSDEKASDED